MMHHKDKAEYIRRYEERLREFGTAPQALGWADDVQQRIRFAVLCENVLSDPKSSILDVGCGFGDLNYFLLDHGWRGRYCGIDIIPALIERGRERDPTLDLRVADIDSIGDEKQFDFVVCSGAFNARLLTEDNLDQIVRSVSRMFALCRVQASVNFLSTAVDFQRPEAWHTDPGWALRMGQKLSRRVVLRHDYMPFEFSLFVFKDDRVATRNVFAACTER